MNMLVVPAMLLQILGYISGMEIAILLAIIWQQQVRPTA